MHRFRFLLGSLTACLMTAGLLFAAGEYRRTDVFQFVAGFVLGETGSTMISGMSTPSAGVVQMGGTDVTTLTSLAGTSVRTQDSNGFRHTPPATQTIGAGGIIASDACGAVKNITAAGAVTTDTTNSLTAPAAANTNCAMTICNVGAQSITIDKNANILLTGGADVVLLANACINVLSNGTIWRQTTPIQTST
jgi:hypothetical protein